MSEIWKDISRYPGYQVSNLGRVRGIYGAILKPGKTRSVGSFHLQVYLRKVKGEPYVWERVHVLVCEAFNGPKPFPEAQCLHRDDDHLNNTPGNLYWGTNEDNRKDLVANNERRRSERIAHLIGR